MFATGYNAVENLISILILPVHDWSSFWNSHTWRYSSTSMYLMAKKKRNYFKWHFTRCIDTIISDAHLNGLFWHWLGSEWDWLHWSTNNDLDGTNEIYKLMTADQLHLVFNVKHGSLTFYVITWCVIGNYDHLWIVPYLYLWRHSLIVHV